jgi:polysaccharide biosynthesis protein PslH
MTRRSLLFLSHRLPYPPHNGAALRTYNVIRLLARDFDLHVMCFDRADKATAGMALTDRIAAMAEFGTFEVFPIPQQSNRMRFIADHARSVIRGVPYTYYMHDSAPFEHRLRKLLAEKRFVLAHVDSMDLVRFLPILDGIPVACTHHNVESALLKRRAATERSPLVRGYLAHQAALLQEAEKRWVPKMALNIAVSNADRDSLLTLAPTARIAVVPNGVDTHFFTPGNVATPEGCVFVGGTTWYPNRDALEWYISEIEPAVKAMGIVAPVTWVGRAADQALRQFADDPVLHLTGYVEDIRPFVHRAKCFIAPLRVGGGTRLKILDAWAMGAAVVSTSIGCEGLAAINGENILIADDVGAFATAIARVLRDDTLRRTIGENARQTAVERYSWDVVGADMRLRYLALVT